MLYIAALITTACFGGLGLMLTLSLGSWMVFDNRRRNKVQGVSRMARDVPTKLMRDGPKTDDFRWFL